MAPGKGNDLWLYGQGDGSTSPRVAGRRPASSVFKLSMSPRLLARRLKKSDAQRITHAQ
jgi:hypothetical protein